MKASSLRTTVSVGVAVALAGCGGSRLSLPPNGFHSPTHEYSVAQVEAAFAAHGIRLQKQEVPQIQPNVVFLIGGEGAGVVSVWVKNGPTAHGLLPIPIAKKYRPRLEKTSQGNVGVAWVSRSNAVHASLGELH